MNPAWSQGVLPIGRYTIRPCPLDLTAEAPSFAYGLRRLRRKYTGYAARVRRSQDNSEGDIAFNSNGTVSGTSPVIIANSGSSGFSIGSQQTLAAFAGSGILYISIWYDQGTNGFNATNTEINEQPQLVLGSSGAGNTYPSILFNGARHLQVNQPITALTTGGISGSFLVAARPTAANTESFGGARTIPGNNPDWAWAIQLNSFDGSLTFTAGEFTTSSNPKVVPNSANMNLWKQYSFIRGTTQKTVRINNTITSLNSTNPTNSAPYSTSNMTEFRFKIGHVSGANSAGFKGNVTEAILFPVNLVTADLNNIELNQISHWIP